MKRGNWLRRVGVSIWVALLVLPVTGAALADQGDPGLEQEIRTLLNERDRQIKAVIDGADEVSPDQRAELERIVNDIVDYPAMARYALGSTWSEVEPEVRREFTDLFSRIVRDQSLNNLKIYQADIRYGEIRREGEGVYVETEASLENVTTRVDYVMARQGGEWTITDIILDEVSTAESYQRQFQSVIRQRGFDALLQSLKRRAERIG